MSLFGAEFEQIWPKAGQAIKFSDYGKSLLKKCQDIAKPDINDIDINAVLRKSSDFPIAFATNTCRIMSQPVDRYPQIEMQLASAYPVIHERVLGLYLQFLEHKSKHGHSKEIAAYKSMGLTDLVQRLLTKRCVHFINRPDWYLLISGHEGIGDNKFLNVGHKKECFPLTFENTLSYDEIKLSALLSISSHSEFLNNGSRTNSGVIEKDKTKIEPEGIIMGIIGARFEKPDCMEWQDVLITPMQNNSKNGYGPKKNKPTAAESYRIVWNTLYDEQDFIYSKNLADQNPQRFLKPYKNGIFDCVQMKKRYALTFDTLLLDANARAKAVGKLAYIHVVGIGLGVWKLVPQQNEIFLETFEQRLKYLMPQLANVGVVNFAWFHCESYKDLKHDEILPSTQHANGGIKILFSNRCPADKLPTAEENMLLVVSYAWDGNALPGNEFWAGSLSGSGDPAAACSTLITEIHNAHINEKMINGCNLHIATIEHGIMHIKDYSQMVLNIS